MVYRVYVEKKKELAAEANSLKGDLTKLLQIKGLKDLRIINRYDVENIDKELFDYCKGTVFSEPQLDIVSEDLTVDSDAVFAVEFLPGQFDLRANSAEECIQLISKGERPTVKAAKVYLLYGDLSDKDIAEIKKYVINPVEAREATLEKVDTLKIDYDIPETVATVDGFCQLSEEGLQNMINELGLAMDIDDIKF